VHFLNSHSHSHNASHPSAGASSKTPGHVLHLAQIGTDHGTTTNRRDRMWNEYYFKTYSFVVTKMIGTRRGTLLDVGTSRGYWFRFWKRKGFYPILGVELDPHRAELAMQTGYDEVYNCDAADIPLHHDSVDVAVSNDVFVHILELEHKIAVLREIERVLKPGGTFILNHTMSRAYGYPDYRTVGYCSFLNLHELLSLITNHTGLRITDIKPTYYNFRDGGASMVAKIVRHLMVIPLVPTLAFLLDYLHSRRLPIEQSDSVYLRLCKDAGQLSPKERAG